MAKLYWLRNDLRLIDNKTLFEFSKDDGLTPNEGIILFCESKSLKRASSTRRDFLFQELAHFSYELSPFGQKIFWSTFDINTTLKLIENELSIDSIYFTREFDTEELIDEKEVLNYVKEKDISVHFFDQSTLIHPEDLPFKISDMPFIFTDFRKKVEATFKIRPLAQEITTLPIISQLSLPTIVPQEFKETGLARIEYYFFTTKKISSYKEARNGLLNYDDSTKFSKWLNTGSLSVRKVYTEVLKYEQKFGANESTYWVIFELLWRDYFKFLSLKYGEKIFLSGGITQRNRFKKNQEAFERWKMGKTGVRFIDANMRELNQTGYMSNRGRQNVASYLIHDLGVDWIMGALYFEEKLIDYDPDLNYGNWLYLSGNGTDPRARKFNIEKQSKDYDPDGLYQQKWS